MPGLPLPADRTIAINRLGRLGKVLEFPFRALGLPLQLAYPTKRLRPSLIHAHFGIDAALALPLARSLQIPMIVTYHGFDATMRDDSRRSFRQRLYLRRRKELQREVPLVLAVSDFVRKSVLAQGFEADKVRVHYTGVDTDFFLPSPGMVREPIVLFVGRLVENKGCDYLIRAMAEVHSEVPDSELVVIGDGPLRHQLEAQARQTSIRHKFLGTQTPSSVREWMNRSKVLCVPSVTISSGASEGFGMVFAEAQAMGLPVVSSFSGGIPEAVAHGETGFLAQERASDELAMYILKLLRDDDTWREFSIAGRRRVEERFDLRRQTALLEEIYHEVETGFLSPEFEPVGR